MNIIATPHGVEVVEAVERISDMSDVHAVRHIGGVTTYHDTDPRIEPTYPEWRINILGNVTDYAEFDNETSARQWLKKDDTLSRRPHYPVTLAGKSFTLVGEWVEVEE